MHRAQRYWEVLRTDQTDHTSDRSDRSTPRTDQTDNRFSLHDLDLNKADIFLICIVCIIYSSCCRVGADLHHLSSTCFLGWDLYEADPAL